MSPDSPPFVQSATPSPLRIDSACSRIPRPVQGTTRGKRAHASRLTDPLQTPPLFVTRTRNSAPGTLNARSPSPRSSAGAALRYSSLPETRRSRCETPPSSPLFFSSRIGSHQTRKCFGQRGRDPVAHRASSSTAADVGTPDSTTSESDFARRIADLSFEIDWLRLQYLASPLPSPRSSSERDPSLADGSGQEAAEEAQPVDEGMRTFFWSRSSSDVSAASVPPSPARPVPIAGTQWDSPEPPPTAQSVAESEPPVILLAKSASVPRVGHVYAKPNLVYIANPEGLPPQPGGSLRRTWSRESESSVEPQRNDVWDTDPFTDPSPASTPCPSARHSADASTAGSYMKLRNVRRSSALPNVVAWHAHPTSMHGDQASSIASLTPLTLSAAAPRSTLPAIDDCDPVEHHDPGHSAQRGPSFMSRFALRHKLSWFNRKTRRRHASEPGLAGPEMHRDRSSKALLRSPAGRLLRGIKQQLASGQQPRLGYGGSSAGPPQIPRLSMPDPDFGESITSAITFGIACTPPQSRASGFRPRKEPRWHRAGRRALQGSLSSMLLDEGQFPALKRFQSSRSHIQISSPGKRQSAASRGLR